MEINLYIYRHNPDLIIVDYLMWGKNGLKMLEDITMNDSSIPVVLFTGFPGELGVYVDPSAPHDDQAATYCGELGFDGYVEKSWHTAYGRLRDIIQGFENVK
jgi:CheY-like chemotaxis protein